MNSINSERKTNTTHFSPSLTRKTKLTPLRKKLILIIISIFMFTCFTFMFYGQLNWEDGASYFSDTDEHLEFAQKGTGYSVLYWLIYFLYKITGTTFSIVILQSILMIATWVVTAKLINVIFKDKYDFFFSSIIALPVMFLSGIYVPRFAPWFYDNQVITQPYHNITYIGMRFCACFCMIAFFKIFKNYLNKIKFTHWTVLTVLLMISTAIKPSFFYGFALTLLFFLIYDFFKNKTYDFIKNKSSRKRLIRIIAIGSTVLLSLPILILQANMLYGGNATQEESKIIFVWGETFVKKGLIITSIKIIRSLMFPFMVWIANRKILSRIENFSFLSYIIQLSLAIILSESGPRANHGNFYWGVYSSAFFLFAVVYPRFIDNLKNYQAHNKLYIVSGSVLMVGHVLSGFAYLLLATLGQIFI